METPLHQRRKKHAVEDALREEYRNKPVFSSKYKGLEKEVIVQDKPKGVGAEIHEGKVSALNLHVRKTGGTGNNS